jgi:hypothetical protein
MICEFNVVPLLGFRYDGSTLLSCIELYDPAVESWELLDTAMMAQRCDAGVTVVRQR